MTTEKKTFRTISEIMEMPAGESEPIIMRAAPAIGRVADAVGLFDIFFNKDVITSKNADAMAKLSAKERQRVADSVLNQGKELTSKLLTIGLGPSFPDFKEIVAAINGITLDELNKNYTTADLIDAIKTLLNDKGFLSLLSTFGD